MMGLRAGGCADSFVVVSYDFEYSTEEGKRVWMKEGEVLLLLAKTNNDWWQVIRRGDRRPFYAPARYVAELSNDAGEWDSVFSGDGVHYRPDNGEPIAYQEKRNNFSTFLGGSNKRSSYAPPPSYQGPPSSDFLFGAPRFQERYRSNSMDSILVADMNRHVFKPKQYTPAPNIIEKRPTFDNIDKRASWSHDKSQYMAPRPGYPVYSNSVLAPVIYPQVGIPIINHAAAGLKKPVPLPRSKIPLPTKAATMERTAVPPPELRTFKRSKTDLSLGMLSKYKASRAVADALPERQNHRGRSPGSAVSTFSQGKGSLSSQDSGKVASNTKVHASVNPKQNPARRPSTSRINERPAVIKEEKTGSALKKEAPKVESLHIFEKSAKSDRKSTKSESLPVGQSSVPPKPAIKEKPSVPLIKSNLSTDKELIEKQRRILRVQSESDLVNKIESEAREGLGDTQYLAETGDTSAPHSIEGDDELKISLRVEGFNHEKSGQDRLTSSREKLTAGVSPEEVRRNSQDRSSSSNRNRSARTSQDRSPRHSQDGSENGGRNNLDWSFQIYSPDSLRPRGTEDRTDESRRASRDRSSEERNLRNSRDDRSDPPSLIQPDRRARAQSDRLEIKENLNPFSTVDSKPNSKKFIAKKVTNDKFLDMDSLPDPPPTPPGAVKPGSSGGRSSGGRSSDPINIPGESAPLVISTEPMSTSTSSVLNKSEDKSNFSSSFDSLDGSLESTGWPEGGEWLGSEPNRGSLVSPNNSTCSRAPASPLPGLPPLRHLFTDWDEYVDSSGRKFYYNLKTREKSWKPPRRIRGTSEGYSAPTSPDPFLENGDSAFEMSPGLSESESRSVGEDDKIPADDKFSYSSQPHNSTYSSQPHNSKLDDLPPGRLDSLESLAKDSIRTLNRPSADDFVSMDSRIDEFRRGSEDSGRVNEDKLQMKKAVDRNRLNELDGRLLKSRVTEQEDRLPRTKNELDGRVERSRDETVGRVTSNRVEERERGVPNGYEIKSDPETGEQYYVNIFTGVSWYSAQDRNGRTYYYEENGKDSCWDLPNVSQTFQDHSVNPSPVPDSEKQRNLSRDDLSSLEQRRSDPGLPSLEPRRSDPGLTSDPSKTESLRQKFYSAGSNVQIGEVSIVVLKQGPLHKTRLEERGKKYRKNWSVSNLVLTDTFLLFYKDSKTFASLQTGGTNSKPDQVIDLKGAQIEWCNSDKSKRSNVFELSTVLEQKLLLQDDDFTVANDWFSRIENVIVTLSQRELVVQNARSSALLNVPDSGGTESASSTLQSKKSKIGRTKSLKLLTIGSRESGASCSDLDSPSVVSIPLVKEKSRIREKLRKFFLRRPGVEDLMKRGIMKNEPVFGSTLTLLAKADHCEVPLFVKKCIQIIESKPEYLSTDGVYRQSGNLSTVQRLRLQVDHGNPNVLESVDDVHVLTGALKLFFRELKEPLIPWDSVERLMAVCNLPSKKAKVKGLKDIVSRLQSAHQVTLIALLRHLEKVTMYKEVNRMAVSNLAIVFGPTLMWPPAHLTNTNMALNMMQQNMIVEALISNLNQII